MQIIDTERPEHVIHDGVGHFDIRMPLHHAARFKRLEHERVDVLLQRHTVLEAFAHRDGKTRKDAAQGCAFLGQVDEQLAKRSVFVLAGTEEYLVSADAGLLGESAAAGREEEARRLHPLVVCLGR